MVENVIRLIRELDEQIDKLKHTAGEDVTKIEEQLKAVENAINELEKTDITVPDDLFQLRDFFREHREQIAGSKETLQTLKTELIALLDKFDGIADGNPEQKIAEESVEKEEATDTIQKEQRPETKAESEEQVEAEVPTETIHDEEIPDFDEEPEGTAKTIHEEEPPKPDELQSTKSETTPKSLREILSSPPPSPSENRIIRINEQETEKSSDSATETERSSRSSGVIPPEELRRILLEILRDHNGKATSNDIRTEMEQRLGSSFTSADLARLPNGKLTWWKNVQLERERLIEEGILSNEYHQGMWELN